MPAPGHRGRIKVSTAGPQPGGFHSSRGDAVSLSRRDFAAIRSIAAFREFSVRRFEAAALHLRARPSLRRASFTSPVSVILGNVRLRFVGLIEAGQGVVSMNSAELE